MGQTNPIQVGVLAGEPIRLEGLATIFERAPEYGQSTLSPIVGTIDELLSNKGIDYMVIDLNASSGGLKMLKEIRRQRPGLRLIVIGPAKNDELVMESIIGGARAYLDVTAGPRVVREAIEVVVSGSIWAQRRVLSKLIDRLLNSPETTINNRAPHLTSRERQVLDLILMARSNREIAKELGIEERTVKAHVGRLMRKSGAENRIDLSMRALSGSLGPARTGRRVPKPPKTESPFGVDK